MKTTEWRKFINAGLKSVSGMSKGNVLNVGTNQSYQDKEGKLYKDYFPGREYWTMDISRYEEHPRHIQHDITIPYPRKWDTVICMNVLEHCVNPILAASALMKMTERFLFITVPFFYPVHKTRCMNDFWRFTGDSLRLMFKNFDEDWIAEFKGPDGNAIGYMALFERNNG